MIPIRDDQPRFSTPYVTYFLIAFNLLIYFLEATMGPRQQAGLVYELGMIPARITGLGGAHHFSPVAALLPMFTSMFLHGSWMHVIGNMWFLWIFGDNIEDYLGHFKYLVFYLLSGVGAATAHILLNPASRVPTVGASGAIAGVLGAYFLLYPRARVLTWFVVFLFYLPAWIMLGYWFLMQFLSGAASSLSTPNAETGGIAFWAHVGGFIMGIVLIKLFPERKQRYRYGAW
ncbi:MAG: rhomboid family intramembrane serine protease [Acidobacteria bacterium]|jgi:membrane associated rhomboid family serine protease|nr:rhomboid family intramembrane serine protease [Acidobacteriota bacterium]